MNTQTESTSLKIGDLEFTALTAGHTRNAGRPLVICLHGFPDNPSTFRFLVPVLVSAGFRVILPTLRGYEPSSQPADGDYRTISVARDVLAWIELLGEQKVHFIGHDWGAIIGYQAVALAPERFHSLTTIAVPHLAHLQMALRKVPTQIFKSWYISFFQIPVISDWAIEVNRWALLRRLWSMWSPGLSIPTGIWMGLCKTFKGSGVKAAMLAYYRQNLSPGLVFGWTESEAQYLTKVGVPTLAITGADDRCLDTRIYDHVFFDKDFPAGFTIKRVQGAGHFAHLDQPAVVNGLILDWLGGVVLSPGSRI